MVFSKKIVSMCLLIDKNSSLYGDKSDADKKLFISSESNVILYFKIDNNEYLLSLSIEFLLSNPINSSLVIEFCSDNKKDSCLIFSISLFLFI